MRLTQNANHEGSLIKLLKFYNTVNVFTRFDVISQAVQ